MAKPTIDQLAEMIDPQSEVEDLTAIPGYGRVRPDQAKSEAITRLRMIADALEAGKNVPRSAIDLALDFLDSVK